MGAFAFRLDSLHHTNIRSRNTDVDLVTFAVLVNQVDRGHGAGTFPAWAGMTTPTNPAGPPYGVAPDSRSGMALDWTIGPFELEHDDVVHVLYAGVNTSDASLSDQDAERLELDIVNRGVEAAASAPGGLIGELFSQGLGFISDPVGWLIGWQRQGPCNGLVFADAVEFTGGGLENLSFSKTSFSLPNTMETQITKFNYTDEATHNHANCGDIAQTDVSFSILKVTEPFSVKTWVSHAHPSANLKNGLQALEPNASSLRLKKVMHFVP
ncbi:MAG: hypothetical protein JWO64_3692 [Hyphomicrobiales bacterium]|nr:hypothetical protein [Hyphomicrobiales bacterium]